MPAALLAAPVLALLLQATPETLADLERAYDQTCNSRVYGQFDDLCMAMQAQVDQYRAELKHRPRPARAVTPAPPAVSPAPPTQPPAEHEPLASAPPKG